MCISPPLKSAQINSKFYFINIFYSVLIHIFRYKTTKPLIPISPQTSKASKTENISKNKRDFMMIKQLKSRRFCRSSSKVRSNNGGGVKGGEKDGGIGEIKWEVRPGGMLVQRRDFGASVDEEIITIRVSTVSHWHDISIQATSTFGELKIILSMMTNLEPREQRLLFKGKEREDDEFLHMVGVRDKDKVLLLEDPAIKEMKLHGLSINGGQLVY